jgi:hypothetical protein
MVVLKTLVSFTRAPNGANPSGSLIADVNVDLFGTTQPRDYIGLQDRNNPGICIKTNTVRDSNGGCAGRPLVPVLRYGWRRICSIIESGWVVRRDESACGDEAVLHFLPKHI